ARDLLDSARATVARALAVKPLEIVWTSGGTESNNIAILGGEWRHAITTTIEHSATTKAFERLAARGVRVSYVAPESDGLVSIASVLGALTDETDFISIHHVHSELGVVQRVADIARAVKAVRKSIVVHVDAAQSPLWLDVSPHMLRADLVSYDAQKVGGPKGAGILWRDYAVTVTSIYGGGSQERGIRPGTEHVAAAVSAAVAFTEAVSGRKARAVQVAKLRDFLVAEIQKTLPSAVLLGSTKRRVPNNAFFMIPGVDGDYLAVLMDQAGVAVTPRSACLGSGGAVSEAALAFTGSRTHAASTIRFSLGPTTTKSDIVRAVKALHKSLRVAGIA
ncbi:MAG: aminotransferase class V-fold PLP-dependent enzyme, partial [Candidatus Pacebacteria bacterium]|nr:aminotransferase class V-fold PLP-dependent enzyme [Candidatus Paceibacterota bacterium]